MAVILYRYMASWNYCCLWHDTKKSRHVDTGNCCLSATQANMSVKELLLLDYNFNEKTEQAHDVFSLKNAYAIYIQRRQCAIG